MNRPFEPGRATPVATADGTNRPAVDRHLSSAVRAIDGQFGEGYARDHPELVASMVQASTVDMAVQAGLGAHAEAMTLADRIGREACETILKLKPRFFG